MSKTDEAGPSKGAGWAKPCPNFTREPLARFGCVHCGHAGDYPAAPVGPQCPDCGRVLLALPLAGEADTSGVTP
jgi:hypothetical protein